MTAKLRFRVKARRGLNLLTGEPSNVVTLDYETTLDIPAARVLAGALGKLRSCVLIGREEETGALWFAGSTGDLGHVLTLLELGRLKALKAAGLLNEIGIDTFPVDTGA